MGVNVVAMKTCCITRVSMETFDLST